VHPGRGRGGASPDRNRAVSRNSGGLFAKNGLVSIRCTASQADGSWYRMATPRYLREPSLAGGTAGGGESTRKMGVAEGFFIVTILMRLAPSDVYKLLHIYQKTY
jgi:hypothetical protein